MPHDQIIRSRVGLRGAVGAGTSVMLTATTIAGDARGIAALRGERQAA